MAYRYEYGNMRCKGDHDFKATVREGTEHCSDCATLRIEIQEEKEEKDKVKVSFHVALMEMFDYPKARFRYKSAVLRVDDGVLFVKDDADSGAKAWVEAKVDLNEAMLMKFTRE